jgi:hypothetical protein
MNAAEVQCRVILFTIQVQEDERAQYLSFNGCSHGERFSDSTVTEYGCTGTPGDEVPAVAAGMALKWSYYHGK